MIDTEVIGSKLWLIHLYQEQLDKFNKLGLGKQTENGVKVTKELIEITQRRLSQLTVVYDRKITPRAHALRRAIKRRMDKEKLSNGSTNNSRTTTTSRVQDNGDTRHGGDKS